MIAIKPVMRIWASTILVTCGFLSGCSFPFIRTDKPLTLVKHHYAIADPQFTRTFDHLLGPPLLPGNQVETLLNGDQIFPPMLDAIRNAKKTINLETYIFWDGVIGRMFTDALVERALSGVKVNIILDWYGADNIASSAVKEMNDAGIAVVKYHPLKWYDLPSLDRRTHRKLLIVDGKIGFSGGVGIADNWLGHAESPAHWRDTHYRIRGPVVAQLQAAFMDNWLKSKAEVLDGDDYFPPLTSMGTTRIQVFRSSPEEGSSSVQLMYLLLIAAATKEILISSAYFVPDKTSREVLIDAVRRGVDVQLILPGSTMDEALVRTASRRNWGELLKAGVHIYEYQPTMYHTKITIIDQLFSSIGSTNFDNRSFRLNEEANINILDTRFAHRAKVIFEEDKKHSKEITYSAWKHRSLLERVQEQGVRLIESEL